MNWWENGRATPSPLALKQIEKMVFIWAIASGTALFCNRPKDLLAKYFPDGEKGEIPILVISHSDYSL
jgi:hypothetical protein